jgi:hypothetical protein
MSTPAYLENIRTGNIYETGSYPVDIEDWRFDERTKASGIKQFTLVGRFRKDSPKYANRQCWVRFLVGSKVDPDGLDPATQERGGDFKRLKEILESTKSVQNGKTWEDQLVATKGKAVQMRVQFYLDDGVRKDANGNQYIDQEYKGREQNRFYFGKLRNQPSAGNGVDTAPSRRVDPAPVQPAEDIEVFDD